MGDLNHPESQERVPWEVMLVQRPEEWTGMHQGEVTETEHVQRSHPRVGKSTEREREHSGRFKMKLEREVFLGHFKNLSSVVCFIILKALRSH